MNNNIVYRLVKVADNYRLAKLIRGVFKEYNADQTGTVYTDPSTDKLYEAFCEKNSELWIAERDGFIVGCCGIYQTKGLPEKCIELVKFYLAPQVRGVGIGKRLFSICEAQSKKRGFNQIYIESIPEFKKAISIYESLGFTLLSERLGESGHFNCNIWLIKNI